MAMVPIWSLLQQKHPEPYEPLKVIIIIFVDIIRVSRFTIDSKGSIIDANGLISEQRVKTNVKWSCGTLT